MEIDYFPKPLVDLQLEILKPAHNGLFVKLFMKHNEEMNSLKSEFEFLTLLCTELGIKLDGEYTSVELAEKILPKLIEERRLQELVIINRPLQ